MEEPASPPRRVASVSAYVPARSVTTSPGCAASSACCTLPNGLALDPLPLPPGATNHSSACADFASARSARASVARRRAMIREDTLFFESERCGMAIAAIVGVLWGSTLFFYFVDRAWRKRPPRVGDDKIRLPGTEPSVWLMLLLTLSCTFTALPYYFYNTR